MKKYSPANSIEAVIQQSGHLAKLCMHIDKINKLNTAVLGLLDRELAEHCIVGNINNNIMTLVTDSSAWNHRLRFITGDLLSQLRKNPKWSFISSIQVKVSIEDAAPLVINKPPADPIKVSSAGAECLIAAAEIIQHEELKKALIRLT
ncbi:MAG: hypothetical protein COB50_04260 [Thiotrichales bacterium]|nr:MAG: hypothetical protein COB50_04260 [Thiotrichales bacterium]